jgi:hypothetical protein
MDLDNSKSWHLATIDPLDAPSDVYGSLSIFSWEYSGSTCEITDRMGEGLGEKVAKKRAERGEVLVLILTNFESRQCDPNVSKLERLFSDPYFIVKKCCVQHISPKPKSNPLTELQWAENYRMRKALEYAALGPTNSDATLRNIKQSREWENMPVVVVKDSSISVLSPDLMRDHIMYVRESVPNADLHFLTVWGDSCSTYQSVKSDGSEKADTGANLVWTVNPNSAQAVMYTPSARDYVSDKLFDSTVPLVSLFDLFLSPGGPSCGRSLKATACVPNVVNFDISLATSTSDYYKLNQCETNATKQKGTAATGFIWFLVIVGLILFVGYCLIVLGPRASMG